jgi:photosystem II stability/assembly factor-like uncharacterized protein
MKKLILFFVALLSLSFNLTAQEGWFEQISGTNNDLNSVCFVNNDTGWAVGGHYFGPGEILKTVDGGENWEPQVNGSIHPLKSVCFIDENTGWVVGGSNSDDGGTILKTTNGGEDWIFQIDNDTSFTLNSVSFIDDSTGWASGHGTDLGWWDFYGIILKTTDGGQNWTIQLNAPQYWFYSIYFADQNTGWITWGGWYTGGILKTTNGGDDWFDCPGGAGLQSIFFIDQNNGWIAGNTWEGNGEIIHTTNGGEYWELQMGDPFSRLNSIYFTDQNNGWVVGSEIINTTDGGENWTSQTSWGHLLNSVYFTNQNTGWVVGYNGTILKTTNGGVTFIEEDEIDKIPTEFLLSQNFPNPFNSSSVIRYSIPQRSNIVVKVYDILGNEIETLVNEEKTAGTFELTWNASNLPSGVYFYQIKAGSFIETKKMILLK